jgi:hypothetical protein
MSVSHELTKAAGGVSGTNWSFGGLTEGQKSAPRSDQQSRSF